MPNLNGGLFSAWIKGHIMKKIWLLSICCACMLVVISDSYGACKAQNDETGQSNHYLVVPGLGTYYCNKEYCQAGAVVAARNASLSGDYYSDSLYTCHLEFTGDLWRRQTIAACTKSKYTKLKDDDNAYEAILNPVTGKELVTGANGASVIARGVEACLGYVCDDGYTESDGKCVKENKNCRTASGYLKTGETTQASCVQTNPKVKVPKPLSDPAHLKSDASCTLTCEDNGWNITLNSDSCEANYGPDTAKKLCVETEEHKTEQRKAERHQAVIRQETNNKKQACAESGGSWSGNKCKCDKTQKHLVLSGDKCVCESADYEFDTASKSCKIKDVVKMEQECTASTAQASGAYWDVEKKVCACDDDSKHFVRGKCEYKPAVIACQKVSGAKWTGKCECTTAGYVVNEAGTQCVKGDALIKTEGQAASRTKIISLYKKLNGMSNDFKVSVWKDAEGNFNTARLASDSIAAVVLGTTGALVTSNIVKKNQVSSGFEDINCQIGGQTVAGWGDEFSVGMQ